jgi:dipeptidyl aminopeptidase/acylaminoacyl peptidase
MDFDRLNTPLLMAFGDEDGSVDWHQGIEAYNFARRLGKEFVLLVYRGENHSNRQRPNQVDYFHRQLEWFDHYLKGNPAPEWITKGVSWIQQENRRAGG